MDNSIVVIGAGLLTGIMTYLGTRQHNNNEATKSRNDNEAAFTSSVMQFSDRKDIEITRLTLETTAQAVRITTLEAANLEKDRRITTLTTENSDLQRQISKMTAKMELLEDMVEGLREMFKRSLQPASNTTVMGMAMGLTTTQITPQVPVSQPPTKIDPGPTK